MYVAFIFSSALIATSDSVLPNLWRLSCVLLSIHIPKYYEVFKLSLNAVIWYTVFSILLLYMWLKCLHFS